MTDDDKKAAANAKRAAARAATIAKRSRELEKLQVAEIRSVWNLIPSELRPVFEYIEREIASGRRTMSDIAFLRETREIHFAPFRRSIKKEDHALNA